jgi:hypothetical protein
VSRLFPKLLPSAEVADYDHFETGGVVEGSNFTGMTIDGSRSGSESSGKTESQSDADRIYKEENFGVLEIEEKGSIPIPKELEGQNA